jgi:lysophospholipase L1-like esterase
LPARSDDSRDCRLGVLAFGDSITNGGGDLQWGVALHSWALWVARGLGLPFTSYAVDGAVVTDVVREQIPAFERGTARPASRYDVGCLYIGVNDVRGLQWDRESFASEHRAALESIRWRSDRTLALTAPLGLGWPRAGVKVRELNSVIEQLASELGVILVDLSSFGARNHVMADRVHPTAFGQLAIAERALAALRRDGLPTRVQPASLIRYETTRGRRLRSDWTYAYRSGKLLAGVLTKRAVATAKAHTRTGKPGGASTIRQAAPPPP